jgi:glycosyltransferase involved in cell wall biosynthesis
MRLLTIGSVSPTNGGETQGGVATQHSMINQEFMKRMDLGIHLVGVIATNTKLDKDPITGVDYYHRNSGESIGESLERIIELTKPDVILVRHITHRWAASLSKIRNKPQCVGFVHSVNAIDPSINPNHLSKAKLMNQALEAMDILVFNSPHSISRAGRLGLAAECELCVIPPSARWEFHEKFLRVRPQKEKVLFVGKLDQNKRIIEVIEALSDFPSFELVIAGDGPLKKDVIDKIISTPNQSIIYHENLRPAEIAKELTDCSLLCVPSKYESFGLVYIESLCMGIPIIGYEESINFINTCLEYDCGVPIIKSVKESIRVAIKHLENKIWNREIILLKARNYFNPYRHAKELAEKFHTLLEK